MLNKLIDLWLTLFYLIINLIGYPAFTFLSLEYREQFKRNVSLQSQLSRKTVYILMNGPSAARYDIESLRDKFTICANHAQRTEIYKSLAPTGPKIHCAIDNNFFSEENAEILEDLIENSPAKFIFNQNCPKKYWKRENVFITFTKHLPTFLNVRYGINSRMSSFSNVSLFCIAVAMSLGAKKIVLIGYDFNPGVFSHVYDDGAPKKSANGSRQDVFAWNLGYMRSLMEAYMLAKVAKRKGIQIVNSNPESFVKAFDFTG